MNLRVLAPILIMFSFIEAYPATWGARTGMTDSVKLVEYLRVKYPRGSYEIKLDANGKVQYLNFPNKRQTELDNTIVPQLQRDYPGAFP